MKAWILLAIIVGSTAMGDLLQSLEMKRHGEIRDFGARGIARLLKTLALKKYLILAIVFMAVSFFAFMTLVETADLSFAVPASAASLVLETLLARLVLREKVDARRWMGAALVAMRRLVTSRVIIEAILRDRCRVPVVRDRGVSALPGKVASGRPGSGQPVSILKPVQGLDPALRAAIESHSNLHGDYELLCGVRSLDDPAVGLLREFPRTRIIECATETPNGKVGVLMDLECAARYPILIVNDADIRVEPDYLQRVTAPL